MVDRSAEPVDLGRLERAVREVKSVLQDGLIAMDIGDRKEGISLVGFNMQAKEAGLLDELAEELVGALQKAAYPGLGRYFYVDLAEAHGLISVLDEAGLLAVALLDTGRINLGVLFGVAVPKLLTALRESHRG